MSDQSPMISALVARHSLKTLPLIMSSALSFSACQQMAGPDGSQNHPVDSRLGAQSESLTGSLIQLDAPIDYECVPMGDSAQALIKVKEAAIPFRAEAPAARSRFVVAAHRKWLIHKWMYAAHTRSCWREH